MKKIKIVALSLCMALICSISLVGCEVNYSSTPDSTSSTQYTSAEAYVNSLLENFNYNVDYTYTDPNAGEDKTVYHTYKNGIEYIYRFAGSSSLNGDVTEYYNTITYTYEDNYIVEYDYIGRTNTYTTTSYIGTSSYAYMISKMNMWTTDGVLILFANYESIALQQDVTAVISNSVSSMETENGVTTLTKTFDYSDLEESCSVKIVINVENGLVTSCDFLTYDATTGIINSSMTAEYTYRAVSINTDFSDYEPAS